MKEDSEGAVASPAAQPRSTFRTRDRVCDNCGYGLASHEQQVFCPVPCKYCNDEGVVHTHEGEIIGPCVCVTETL